VDSRSSHEHKRRLPKQIVDKSGVCKEYKLQKNYIGQPISSNVNRREAERISRGPMRFYGGNSSPMEVGDSAFTNEDDADNHVVADKADVDINDEVEDEDGEKQDDETVGLRQSTGTTACLVHAADTFAENDEDVSVPFLAGSPSVSQGIQFIDASNGSITTDSSSSVLKTTHIVIHKQALKGGLVSPLTPLPPPTPATPSARERGFRYQWDQSAFEPVLPVRCKSSNGELYKTKFGSGMLFDSRYGVLQQQLFS